MKVPLKVQQYAKFIVALTGVVALIAKVLVDGTLTTEEIVMVGGAILVALGVRQIPNAPLGK